MAVFGMGGPGPMGFGPSVSGIMDINPGFIYGRAIASGDKYTKWREKISFKDAEPIDEMYYGDTKNQIKARANIEKKLHETTKYMTVSTKEVRKNYAKVIIINSILALKEKYGSLDFSKNELDAKKIQDRVTQDLCTKDTGNEGILLSDCEEFYNKKRELIFIESFISKAYRNRNNKNWLNDNIRNAGNDYQHYYSGLTVYHYHNYNIYNFLLGNFSLEDFDSDLSRIPGMLPDMVDESELYTRLMGKKKDETNENTIQEENNNTNENVNTALEENTQDIDMTPEDLPDEEVDDTLDTNDTQNISGEDLDTNDDEIIEENNVSEPKIIPIEDGDADKKESDEKIEVERKNVDTNDTKENEEKNTKVSGITALLDEDTNSISIQSNIDELNSWRDLITNYLESYDNNSNSNTNDISFVQPSSNNKNEELVEMLSNIEEDEVDLSSMKGLGK